MSKNYKLIYNFKKKDPNNHILKAEKHPTEKFEISTITIPSTNTVTKKTTPSSSSVYTIQVLSPIMDQGNIGDCVANAFAYCINVQTRNKLNISRLYLYAICRILDNTPLIDDSGTTVGSGCNAIKKYGTVNEKSYPYNSDFTTLPSLTVIKSSSLFKTFTYTFVNQDITSIKNCLYIYNVPIIFGFLVYSSFITITVATTGMVSYPNVNTETLEGGHCMCIVGYNDTTKMFTCANSWGTSWGNKGYCYIPYKYLLDPNLATDFCFTQFIY